MKFIGSIIIGVLLAIIGICPLDVSTGTFVPLDAVILIGSLLLWNILVKD